MKLVSLFKKGAAAAGALAVAGVASAQSAIDPTVVTGSITANEGTITTIGGALLGLVVLIAAYRWVRKIIK